MERCFVSTPCVLYTLEGKDLATGSQLRFSLTFSRILEGVFSRLTTNSRPLSFNFSLLLISFIFNFKGIKVSCDLILIKSCLNFFSSSD